MTDFQVPSSLDEAVDRLGAIGKIVTAQQWERAAILAAFVLPDAGSGGRAEVARLSHLVSAREFSRKGIHGLRSKDTVLRYVNAWLGQRPRPEPGQTIDLTGLPEWPPNETVGERATTMTQERRDRLMEAGRDAGMERGSKVVDIAANTKSLEIAIETDDEVAKVAERALSRRPPSRKPFRPTPQAQEVMDRIDAQSAATREIARPILEATVLLEQAQKKWDEHYPSLTTAERGWVQNALVECFVIAEALRLNMHLEDQGTTA